MGLAKRSYDDDTLKALSEMTGLIARLSRLSAPSAMPLRQDRGLGDLWKRSKAMSETWEGLPAGVEANLELVREKAGVLLKVAAAEAYGVSDHYDIPDNWEQGSFQTQHHRQALLDLAGLLYDAQEQILDDYEQSPSYNPHLASLARQNGITISGQKYPLERSAPAPEIQEAEPVTIRAPAF